MWWVSCLCEWLDVLWAWLRDWMRRASCATEPEDSVGLGLLPLNGHAPPPILQLVLAHRHVRLQLGQRYPGETVCG